MSKDIRTVTIRPRAKINLSIDVVGKRPDGMHEVDMVMQAIDFRDEVTVSVLADGQREIRITCDRPSVPTDHGNICWKAVELMRERARDGARVAGGAAQGLCSVHVDIRKRIPVAGGMAGGSGNGAAVLCALNLLWELGLSTEELMELGGKLGADVPFCVLAIAAEGAGATGTITVARDSRHMAEDVSATGTITVARDSRHTAARARGTGTEIEAITPLRGYAVFAKPDISVSTKDVYRGIDACEIASRPDNDRLARELALASKGPEEKAAEHRRAAAKEMINVLELYTLGAEPAVAELKALMERELKGAEKILMSGSGPTVFALFGESDREAAEAAGDLLRAAGYEAHCAAL